MGQPAPEDIQRVAFHHGLGQVPGCEVMTLAELRERAPASEFVRPQRLLFHLLLSVEGGRDRHLVDFAEVPLRAGTVLWARAGQVHQWGAMGEYDATLAIVDPTFLDTALLDGVPPAAVHHAHGVGPLTARVRDLLGAATDPRPELTEGRRATVMRHLLAAVLLDLDSRSPAPDAASGGPVHTAFVAEVEQRFRTEHDVTAYAASLGWSTRTLARATRAATGLSPKEVIDARVMLEARRLLAHSDLGVARIGEQLGFAEPSNFSKYFHQRARATPGEFRRRYRA